MNNIISLISNNSDLLLLSSLISISGLGIWKILDKLIMRIMLSYFPEKYILNIVRKLDDKIIDKMKLKTPEAAIELENRICSILDKAKKIIKDLE